MNVQKKLPFLLLLSLMLSCQSGNKQDSAQSEETTEAVEQPEEVPFNDYSFEQFIMQFDVAIKVQPLPKEFSLKYLDGEPYIPIEVISNTGTAFVCLVSNQYAAESYVVFSLSPEGEKVDKKILLNSEGGDLYHYKVQKDSPFEFTFVETLDLSLYDESIEGPMSEEMKNSLSKEKKTYYLIADDGTIQEPYLATVEDIQSAVKELSPIERYFILVTPAENRAEYFGTLMNHKGITKNGQPYKGCYAGFNEISPENGFISYWYEPGYGVEWRTNGQIVYWNLSDGRKLVGVAEASGAMVMEESSLNFYYVDTTDQLTPVNNAEIIPEISQNTWLVDSSKQMDCNYFTMIYSLPKKGKDITVTNESDCMCCETKGDQLTLKWADGKFEMGEFTSS